MSTSSGAVSVGDSRRATNEATERSSSTLPISNTSQEGSNRNSTSTAPMAIQRSQSINIRELFSASHPENDFYVPEVFDAMDEGMELEEAFIQAQRAALTAINDAALARAIQESQREVVMRPRAQRSSSVEVSRPPPAQKYALVSPSELGGAQGRNRSRPDSASSASTASSSSSSSASASTAVSSVLSSSMPKAAVTNQPRQPAVKSVSAPATSSTSRTPSSAPYTPSKVPVIPASAPASSLSMSRPTAYSSKSFVNTPTAASAKSPAAHHQNSNQASQHPIARSGSKSIRSNSAAGSGPSRKAPTALPSTAPVAQPMPITSKTTAVPTSAPCSSSPAMAPRPSTSPSARDIAMGMISSTSTSSTDSDEAQHSRHSYSFRQRLRCSRCLGSSRVKCRCPLSYLLAVEQTLASFDEEFVALVAGDSLSRPTTEKQRQLFLARVLLRNEMATRPFESLAIKTLDSLQKSLAGLKDATLPSSSSDDSDSSDSPEFDRPSSLDLHFYLQSLVSASLLPSFIHFFLSHPNAQDWMKFADLYIGMLTFLRRMVESGGGSILNEPLVVIDRRQLNSGLVSSIWDVVLNRLERQTRPELIKAATAIKFGGTLDKVNRMCDGIMWLVLQDLTD